MSKQNQFCMPPYASDEDLLTVRTYQEIFYRIERIAINAIRWKNLPDGLDAMLIERYMFYWGNVVIFYDDILERYIALPMNTEMGWDINWYPTKYTVVGFNGYFRELDVNNSVIIWNNYQMNPSSEMAGLLATRLTNALRTGDMHLEYQKVGKIISVPETQKKTARSLVQRIKNFNLYTIGSSALKDIASNTAVLDTEVDYIVDKLDNHYSFLWHDCLSYFGITSMSNKLSGVTPAEMSAENSMAIANRSAMINSRKDGIQKVNEMFGIDIEIEFLGGDDYGELYNNTENDNGESDGEDESGQLQSD